MFTVTIKDDDRGGEGEPISVEVGDRELKWALTRALYALRPARVCCLLAEVVANLTEMDEIEIQDRHSPDPVDEHDAFYNAAIAIRDFWERNDEDSGIPETLTPTAQED